MMPAWIGRALERLGHYILTQGYALRPTNANALSQVSTEELLLELRRRIIAPATDAPSSWDDWDGLDPHGDWRRTRVAAST